MINACEEYILFYLFIRLPVFIRAYKVTELSLDFNLQIIYLLVYQHFVFPSSNQEFFDVICKCTEEINPTCFFVLQLKCHFENK